MKKQNLKSAILFAVALLLIIGSIVPMMTERAMAGSLVSITFDANASDGHVTSATGPKVRTISTYDRQYQYSWSFPNAYRTGYTFGGWYDNASCTGTRVLPTNWKTSQTKLYAKWTPVTYTITFKPNGGTGGPTSQVKTHGKTLTITSSKPTKTGYDFVGWATSAGGSAQYYANGSYTKNEGATLYAVWKKKKFTITIYTSAGGPNGSTYTYTKEYGASFTIPSTSAPTGYYLAGYGIPTATTDVKYHVGDVYKEDKHLTLYPIFYKKTYPVTYNANGGSNPPANQTKTYGENLTLASGSPSRTGYTFLGWGTAANATTVSYSPNSVYTGNAELKLFAIWRINTYSVTYNANGGTGAPASQTKTYNVNLTLATGKPTRTGYTFQGWGTSAGATTVAYNPGSTYTGNTALALYAIWKIDQYDVVYNANGGTGAPAAVKKTYGQDLKLSGTIPTRDGYDFKGWATSASGAVAYAANGTYKNNSAVTLYAVWAKKTYSITVYASTGANGSAYTYTKEHGVNFTIPSTSAPTGHYLAGYGVPGATSTVKYHVGDVYKDNAHLTLYPIFKKLTYAVNYNANGGSNAPTSQIKTYGENLVLQTTVPVRTGYDFLGWATSANGPVAYSVGGTYSKNEAVTLYAVFKKKTFTVTIFSNPSGPNGSAYTMTKEFGESVTIPSTTAPTGQYLAGYGIPGATTTVKYHVGDTYSDNANITLYPIFITYTYPVTLDVNGGDEALAALVKTYGEDLDLGTVIPKREGYDFQGWSDTPDGSVKWAPGAHYSADQAGTLYAVWKIKTYRIGFNGYGAPSGVLKTHGVAITLPEPTMDRDGYVFAGWSTHYMSTTPSYQAGDLYEGNMSTEFCAIWEPVGYLLKYYPNGGVGYVPDQVKTEGEPLTLSSVIPQREGYTFRGWATTFSCDYETLDTYTGEFYEPGDVYARDASQNMYAVWTENHYTVQYHYDYGDDGEVIYDILSKTYAATEQFYVNVPLHGDKTWQFCIGWSRTEGATEVEFRHGNTTGYEALSKDDGASIDLYPVWKENEVTITYHWGTNSPEKYSNPYVLTYESRENRLGIRTEAELQSAIEYASKNGITLDTSGELTIPEREGLVFLGWTLDDPAVSYPKHVYSSRDTVGRVIDDWKSAGRQGGSSIHLYAIWRDEQFAKYHVGRNGGVWVGLEGTTLFYLTREQAKSFCALMFACKDVEESKWLKFSNYFADLCNLPDEDSSYEEKLEFYTNLIENEADAFGNLADSDNFFEVLFNLYKVGEADYRLSSAILAGILRSGLQSAYDYEVWRYELENKHVLVLYSELQEAIREAFGNESDEYILSHMKPLEIIFDGLDVRVQKHDSELMVSYGVNGSWCSAGDFGQLIAGHYRHDYQRFKQAFQKFQEEKFGRDSFKGQYAFEVTLENRADWISKNAALTCELDDNVFGVTKTNEMIRSGLDNPEKDIEDLRELRKTVPAVTQNTVMQKVIPEDTYNKYIDAKNPLTKVTGCVSRGVDVARICTDFDSIYENLRLDYCPDDGKTNPYKEIIDKPNGKVIYLIRFTSDYLPTNDSYPIGWTAPCTGTGFLSSKYHLIPEYTYGGFDDMILDGAIFAVDASGEEHIVAYWLDGRFQPAE